jgi:hypothetical protein
MQAILPSRRVLDAAQDAGLGALVCSFRVNERSESFRVLNPLTFGLAGVGLIVYALAFAPQGGRALWVALGVLCVGIGLVLVWAHWPFLRAGPWLVHRFESGLVMERTRGALYAGRYGEIKAWAFHYFEQSDSGRSEFQYMGLELLLPGGAVCSMSAAGESGHALHALGYACGAQASAQVPVGYGHQKVGAQRWGV